MTLPQMPFWFRLLGILPLLLATAPSLLFAPCSAAQAAPPIRYAPVAGIISSHFGWRTDPFLNSKRFHAGLDIAAPTGTPVHAPEPGLVVFSAFYGGYGNVVVLKHATGLYTLYGHNSELLVKKGQWVEMGQPLSLVGATGRATGPHLHFEVHYNNHYVDPSDYLLYRQQELVAQGILPNPENATTAVAAASAQQRHHHPVPLPAALGGPAR